MFGFSFTARHFTRKLQTSTTKTRNAIISKIRNIVACYATHGEVAWLRNWWHLHGIMEDEASQLEEEDWGLHFTGVHFWHSSSNWANTDSVTAMGITGPLYTKSPATL